MLRRVNEETAKDCKQREKMRLRSKHNIVREEIKTNEQICRRRSVERGIGQGRDSL